MDWARKATWKALLNREMLRIYRIENFGGRKADSRKMNTLSWIGWMGRGGRGKKRQRRIGGRGRRRRVGYSEKRINTQVEIPPKASLLTTSTNKTIISTINNINFTSHSSNHKHSNIWTLRLQYYSANFSWSIKEAVAAVYKWKEWLAYRLLCLQYSAFSSDLHTDGKSLIVNKSNLAIYKN